MKTNFFPHNGTYLLVSLMFFFSACANESADPDPNGAPTACEDVMQITDRSHSPSNLNVSFLVDLSSRIDPGLNPKPDMPMYKCDQEYIMSVVELFATHVMNTKDYQLNEHIQCHFEPTPSLKGADRINEKLRKAFLRRETDKEKVCELFSDYRLLLDSVYQSEISRGDGREGNYPGADFLTFFNEQGEDYLLRPNHRNILVVLTDGYLYHEDIDKTHDHELGRFSARTAEEHGLNDEDWKKKMADQNIGFVVPEIALDSLEVIVIGLNNDLSSRNDYEFDVLKALWEKWFIDMGVKKENISVHGTKLPSDLKKKFSGLIFN